MSNGAAPYSQHIFLLPFRIAEKNESGPPTQAFLDNVCKTIESAGWSERSFDPQNVIFYNEWMYFHDFARKSLYQLKDEKYPVSRCFERAPKGPAEETPHQSMVVRVAKRNKPPRDFELRVEGITLRLFETGVGVLALQVGNYKEQSLKSVLLINDYARRFYPQFLTPEKGIDRVKWAFFPDKVDWRAGGVECADKKPYKSEDFLGEELQENRAPMAGYVQSLLGEELIRKYRLSPAVDDRMFVVCWVGDEFWSQWLSSEKEHGVLEYQDSDVWYQYVFVDNDVPTCKNEEMKKRLLRDHTYGRWSGYGMLYGVTRYSFVCLTNRGSFARKVVRKHLQQHYKSMAELLLAQRASLLKFQEEISRISGKCLDLSEEVLKQESSDENGGRNGNLFSEDDKPTELELFKKISRNVFQLHARYLRFMNRLGFMEVTAQDQGIELFDLGRRSMNLPAQMENLQQEMRELSDFVEQRRQNLHLKEERERNRKLAALNFMAFLFLPLTLAAALWAMDIPFIRDLFPKHTESGPPLVTYMLLGLASFLAVTVVLYTFASKVLESRFNMKIRWRSCCSKEVILFLKLLPFALIVIGSSIILWWMRTCP
jgi:Mg2+ and Co2+ transporter CorA